MIFNHYRDFNFKVVEINNSVALRSGHIIAQAPLHKADRWSAAEYVQNGVFFNLDFDGALKAPGDAPAMLRATQNAMLHFTEELFTGPSSELKSFAVEWVDDEDGNDVAYPRVLVLGIGDTFTTNNFTGSLVDGVAIINANGILKILGEEMPVELEGGYAGPAFQVVDSTLPDGYTSAGEFTYIGNIVIVASDDGEDGENGENGEGEL
jgi:hypothetical protein